MASGTRLREAGVRKPAQLEARPHHDGGFGASGGAAAEHRLNVQQVYALEHMFQSNPAVQAARTVLSGQLLSGGISLRKDGKDVPLTTHFRDHLNDVWIPFASDVIDCLLKWGLVPIAYHEHVDSFVPLANRRLNGVPPKRQRGTAASNAAAGAGGVQQQQQLPAVTIPIVPTLGSYEVAYSMAGGMGYVREYRLHPTFAGHGSKSDDGARVVVRQHPDSAGNVNSPLSAVFELGSFVSSLTELALTAESSCARPRITTQLRKRDNTSLDPGNLFFDSESQAALAGADSSEGAAAARSLQLQQQLCAVINRMQTHRGGGEQGAASSSRGLSATGYAPPDVAPQLFTLPKDQELCPNVQSPESRRDLEPLMRMAVEQFCAALGVPSDLIFSGRFAGKSTSQLSLLNTTTSQLAKAVNSVLTTCYRDIYATGHTEDIGQLQLLTSPMAATDEVLAIYTGGLAPLELAMPSVLHAIGVAKDDIEHAVRAAVAQRDAKPSHAGTDGTKPARQEPQSTDEANLDAASDTSSAEAGTEARSR